MSASLALLDSSVNGSIVFADACSVVSSGKYIVLFDGPIFGKFIVSGTKCDVAPESMIRLCCCLLAFRRVHLFPAGLLLIVCVLFISSCVSSSSSSISCDSGVQ